MTKELEINKVYGYIRVSSDKQTVENQRHEIKLFAERKGLVVNSWIEETISGTKSYNKRRLGDLLKNIKKDDLIISSELSRLGRNLFMIMEILSLIMKKEAYIWTIKDNYRLGDDIQSKVLAFAFGLSAEIERNLISQRTSEALKAKRANGAVLGRPTGRKTTITKNVCFKKDEMIMGLLALDVSRRQIAKIVKVNRNTLARYLEKTEPYRDEFGVFNHIQYDKDNITRSADKVEYFDRINYDLTKKGLTLEQSCKKLKVNVNDARRLMNERGFAEI